MRGNGVFRALGMLAATVLPAAAQELALDQAVSAAFEHNRMLQGARLEVKKGELEAGAARTYRLPTLKVNFEEAQLLYPVKFVFPAGVWGTYAATGPIPAQDATISTPRHPITLISSVFSQPISYLHRINLGIRLREMETEAARGRLRAIEQSVAYEVRKGYYQLLQTQSALAANASSILTLKELSRLAAENAAQQVVLKSEELEMKARVARAEYDSASLELALATGKEQLNDLMGRDPHTEFQVQALPVPSLEPADLGQARMRALAEGPEIREAKLRLKEAEVDRALKRSEYLPEVNAEFQYLSPFQITLLPKNVTVLGITVKWDVLDWGRKKKELAVKSYSIEQAKLAVERAESQAILEVEDRYRKLDASRRMLSVVQMAQETAREKARIANERYEAATVLRKDVLDAKASLADADYQYQQALATYLTAQADFDKVTGKQ